MSVRRGVGRAGALLAAILVATGCGYTLRSTLPAHIQTVAVPVFKNRTAQPGVENFITRAVADAFATNGRLRVVKPEQADAVLDGEITGYQVDSVAFDPAANVRQYRLTVTMNLRFRDVRDNKVLYARNGVQERADFRVSSAVSGTLVLEQSALRTAAVDIGRAVVSAAIERF